MFVQLDELNELDKITHAWIGFNYSLTQTFYILAQWTNILAQWLEWLTATKMVWVQLLIKSVNFL